jgi:hypothetical protein
VSPGPDRFCSRCGNPLHPEDEWCAACGERADALVPSPPAQPVWTGAAQQTPVWTGAPGQTPQIYTPTVRRPLFGPGLRKFLRRTLVGALALGLFILIGAWPTVSGRFGIGAADNSTAVPSSTWANGFPGSVRAPVGRPVRIRLADAASSASALQGRAVILDGTVESVNRADHATQLVLNDNSTRVVAYYPADRPDIVPQTPVTVVGALSPKGDEIAVVALSRGTTGSDLSIGWWRVLAACAGLFLAAVLFRLRRPGKLKAGAAIVAAVVPLLLLTACDVQVHTTVNADGSGKVVTVADPGQDAIDNMNQLPNAAALTSSIRASAESLAERVTLQGSKITIERPFSTFDEFNSAGTFGGATWANLLRYTLPDGVHYILVGHLDARSLLPNQNIAEGQDTSVRDQLRDKLSQTEMDYSAVLPGTLLADGSNASLHWRVPVGGTANIFAETVANAADADQSISAPRQQWLVDETTRWIAAAAAAFAFFALLAFPFRRSAR